MEQEKSAIMQMLMGKRGNLEFLKMTEEYREAQDKFVDKIEEMKKELEKHPKLLALFNELLEASNRENAIYADEVYKEAFSFGLAMGQEVFSK